MGGAVSSGRDNNELIDNLVNGNYIRTRKVEHVFRALDRADYMTPEARDQAYKDLAWRNGPLHLSSPCIYSEVMEGLELKPGQSFLNVGSGTGYLSTMVGLIIGSSGISHGVEVHPAVVEYAVKKLGQFIENCSALDDFDFCEPKYYSGNGLCIAPLQSGYDRVYCGAACPAEYENYFKNLIKVGGVLVFPLNDTLQQVKRVSEDKWVYRDLLNVSFATLREPSQEDALDQVRLDALIPPRLQVLARSRVRACMRAAVIRRNPELKEKPWRRPPRSSCPRRICIPIEPGGDVQNLNVLHDLDAEDGANEMNALLSLVISMGQNRVAGALRFDRLEPGQSDDDSGTSQNGENDESSVESDTDNEDADKELKTDAPKKKGHRHSDTEYEDLKSALLRSDEPELLSKPDPSPEDNKKNKDKKSANNQNSLASRRISGESIDDEKPSTSKDTKTDARPGRGRDDSDSDDDHDDPRARSRRAAGVPSEVEILIPKMQGEAGGVMEWEAAQQPGTAAGQSRAKRQKLDSGLGETPPGCDTNSGDDDAPPTEERRRRSSQSSCAGWETLERVAQREEARRARRRGGHGQSARRVRLSRLMKRAVKELPLPPQLKKFVNLGRCFEF